MAKHEIKLTVSDEEFAFLQFQGVKLNMTIPSVLKKLIKAARDNQKKTLDLNDHYSRPV